MKNNLIIVILIFLGLLSCERELEYGSDFDFNVINVDNTSIQIGTFKEFNLQLLYTKSITKNKNYTLIYSTESGQAELTYGTNLLAAETSSSISFDETNKVSLKIKPLTIGNIKIKITLIDDKGISKTKEFVLKASNEDYRFTFTGSPTTQDGNVTQDRNISLSITNIGLTLDNNFKIKYTSTKTGTLKINNVTLLPNTIFITQPGVINILYNGNEVGENIITFTCINSANEEKTFITKINYTATPFTLTKGADFSVKNTLRKNFNFNLSNIIANAQYQIKFETTSNVSRIWLNGVQQTPSTFVPLAVIASNVYTFEYECLTNNSDNLIVTIKDNFGQTQSINYVVTVLAAPIITSVSVLASTVYDFYYTVTNGATITEISIQQLDNINNNWINATYFPPQYGANYVRVQTTFMTGPNYSQRKYRAKIKDSDGAFSDWYQTVF